MAAKTLPRLNVKAVEEHFGRTEALPDGLVRIALGDGRTFVVDGERLRRQDDGTYVVEVTDGDRRQMSRSEPRDPDDASPGERNV